MGKGVGKVREWYPLPDGQRLIITTDRLSAFDRILAHVPYKGQVLNQLSAWWFGQLQDIIPHHLVSIPDPNAAIVTKAEPLLVEVVVRGYISGVTTTALWYRYNLGERDIYGYAFPDGLKKNQALPEPIITPTTKGGETGHDERLTVNPADLRFLFQGVSNRERAGKSYREIPWRLGMLEEGER